MTSLPSIPEGVEHQSSADSDDVFYNAIPKTSENSGEALAQQEAESEVYEESQTGTVKSRERVIPYNNLPAIMTGTCVHKQLCIRKYNKFCDDYTQVRTYEKGSTTYIQFYDFEGS